MEILKDKVILLTGGTAGIGFSCAQAYIKAGAKLAFVGVDQQSVANTAKIVGDEHLALCGDVSSAVDFKSFIDQTIARFGRIDGIHNNAGIAYPSKAIHETTDQEWDTLMAINMKSVMYSMRYGYECLKESKGCLLNTSSLVGEIGQENHAAYAATKGAINALTKSMAIDYAKDGIRVNSVLPAAVMTPMLKQWITEQPVPSDVFNFLQDIHLLGYCPEGDVIADACVFLLSDMARFITGLNMPVSGGAELGYRRNTQN